MRVFVVSSDYYFIHGLEFFGLDNQIEIISIGPRDIQMLGLHYRLYDSDTLVLALDAFKGRIMDFLEIIRFLSSFRIKTILVSENHNHIRRAGGYQLSKLSPFSEYMRIFSLPCLSYSGSIRELSLSVRDSTLLSAFCQGLYGEALSLVTETDVKKISGYKAQILNKLGLRRFNYLYPMF